MAIFRGHADLQLAAARRPQPPLMRGEFIDVAGARLYYYAAGSRGGGDPILLIHGFPTSGHLWTDVVPQLPAGHRVIVVDLLGYGRSDPPGAHPVSIRGHADRLIALLDVLGVNFACVAGHDVGGAIALTMALRHPQRVSRLALVSAAAFDDWPSREVKIARATLPLTRHLPPTWLISVLRADLQRGYADGERALRSIERFVRPFAEAEGRDAFFQHLVQLDAEDTRVLTPRLKDLVQPTAIVWGRHDPFLPVRIGTRLHAAIPGSSFDVIEDGCHFIPEEAANRVAGAIASLLAR